MIDDRTPKQWDFHTRYPPGDPWTIKLPLKMDGWKPLSFWADDCNYTTWMSFNFCNSNTHEHRRVLFRALNMNRPDLLVQRISSQSDMRHVAPWMQFKFKSLSLWVSDFPIFPPWELINWFWSQPLHPWHRSQHFDAWIQKWHGPRALPQRPTKNASGGLKQCRQWCTSNWNVSCSDVLVRPQVFQHTGLNDFFLVTQVAEADEWCWFIWQNKTWLQQERITGLYQ